MLEQHTATHNKIQLKCAKQKKKKSKLWRASSTALFSIFCCVSCCRSLSQGVFFFSTFSVRSRCGLCSFSISPRDDTSSRCFSFKDVIKDCHGTKKKKEKLFCLLLQSGGEGRGGEATRGEAEEGKQGFCGLNQINGANCFRPCPPRVHVPPTDD